MGVMLDHGSPRAVFATIAAFLFLAIGTVVQVRRSGRAVGVQASAAD